MIAKKYAEQAAVEKERIRQEIIERLRGFVGRIEFSEPGIAQINDSMAEIVKRLYHAGKIEIGPTNDLSSNGKIWLGESVPLDILSLIPMALPEVSERGKYNVIRSGEIIGYVTYAGPPVQDRMNYICYIGTKTAFTPVDTANPNGTIFVDGQRATDCYVYAKRADRDTIEACVRVVPKPMSIEQKYKHAILTLQAISQRSGSYKGGGCDEWSEAAAFWDCKVAAKSALQCLGEQTIMPNKNRGT